MECLLVLEKEAQWSGATSKRMRAAGNIYSSPSLCFPPIFQGKYANQVSRFSINFSEVADGYSRVLIKRDLRRVAIVINIYKWLIIHSFKFSSQFNEQLDLAHSSQAAGIKCYTERDSISELRELIIVPLCAPAHTDIHIGGNTKAQRLFLSLGAQRATFSGRPRIWDLISLVASTDGALALSRADHSGDRPGRTRL